MSFNKKEQLEKRRLRIRQRVKGTSERPRLSVYRSNKNLYAQVINDESGPFTGSLNA
ncbi:MAG: 50S ribosomal protein L18, partial [Candidatus Theseobacter exili]|nr:50S ribosomal protein L18 [Candidatus Theseobacter exili]